MRLAEARAKRMVKTHKVYAPIQTEAGWLANKLKNAPVVQYGRDGDARSEWGRWTVLQALTRMPMDQCYSSITAGPDKMDTASHPWERPSSPTGVEALLGSLTDGFTLGDLKLVDQCLAAEMQTRKGKLEIQVRDFARFVQMVREWRESVGAALGVV